MAYKIHAWPCIRRDIWPIERIRAPHFLQSLVNLPFLSWIPHVFFNIHQPYHSSHISAIQATLLSTLQDLSWCGSQNSLQTLSRCLKPMKSGESAANFYYTPPKINMALSDVFRGCWPSLNSRYIFEWLFFFHCHGFFWGGVEVIPQNLHCLAFGFVDSPDSNGKDWGHKKEGPQIWTRTHAIPCWLLRETG